MNLLNCWGKYIISLFISLSFLSPSPVKGAPGPLATFLRLFLLFAGLHRRRYLLRAKDPLDPCIVGEGRKNSQVPSERNLRVLISSYSHSTVAGGLLVMS